MAKATKGLTAKACRSAEGRQDDTTTAMHRGLICRSGPTGTQVLAAPIRAWRARALAWPRQCCRLLAEGGSRASTQGEATAGRWGRSGRGQEGSQGRCCSCRRQDAHLRGSNSPVLRSAQCQVEEPQARRAIPHHARDLRPSQDRPTVGRRHRHRRGAQGASNRFGRQRPRRLRECVAASSWSSIGPPFATTEQVTTPHAGKDTSLEVLPARGQIQKTEHQPALQFEQLPGFMQELASVKALLLAHLSSRS